MDPERQRQSLNVNIRRPITPISNPSASRRVGLYDAFQANQAEKVFPSNLHEKNERENGEQKNEQKLGIKILDRLMSLSIFMLFFGLPIFFSGVTEQGIIFDKQIYFYV